MQVVFYYFGVVVGVDLGGYWCVWCQVFQGWFFEVDDQGGVVVLLVDQVFLFYVVD